MGLSEVNTLIVVGSALCALEDTKPELMVDAIIPIIPAPGMDQDVVLTPLY